MIVYVYPADTHGCGHYRMIWPGLAAKALGHDVRVIPPNNRTDAQISGDFDQRTGRLVEARVPSDADVIVMQRVTLAPMVEIIRRLRERGHPAVVVDMDDNLNSIDPANPAFLALHPQYGNPAHTAANAQTACDLATMVTVSTPALLPVYAKHGRGVVLENRVPKGFLDIPHEDSPVIGWAGSTHSHPNDLQQVGFAVARLLREGQSYFGIGHPTGLRVGLGLDHDPPATGDVDHPRWPFEVTRIGVGIAPLDDTIFNAGKSWLKPLEYSAVGVPWVASPRAEYARFHRGHNVGFLARNPKDWYRHLKRLCTDPGLRAEQSAAGRAAAAQNTYEDHAATWWQVWEDATRTAERLQPAAPLR